MKAFHETSPTSPRRLVGNLLTQRRILPVLAVAAGLLPASNAVGLEINLVTGTTINGVAATASGSFAAGTSAGGQNTVYELIDTIPAGTGVFQPFLSYQRRVTEEGVNTSQGGSGQGFLDDKRVPQWTHNLRLDELGTITRNGVSYYAFELDANETGVGNNNRLLSIDDIRIYTSTGSPFSGIHTDDELHAAIADDSLGTLRYAQNEPNGTANYVLIDASRRTEGSTSGSGSSDMLVLVPTSLFAGAGAHDFVTFYTINGVHDDAGDDGSDAGFEEWRALTGTPSVPDGGSTLLLLGSVFASLGLFARGRKTANIA